MTTDVISVTPDTSVQELARLLCERNISGAPVVDANNRIVGIVSEGDLLHRTETETEHHTERRRARWLESFATERALARDYVKSHGRLVRDVMTRDVIAVPDTAELAEVADLLETKRIKRVPVLRDGKLVGILSRANLVRALAAGRDLPAEAETDDRAIRDRLIGELRHQEWARIWAADIVVRDGVVHLWCSDDHSPEEREALLIAAKNTPGVRDVEEHLVPALVMPPL
ncbi:MAG TPA: CBS domain-containing protein [Stellaceae bacterium]|nr:CBS domain-containing protein [Stellaceae bacterium]